MIKQLNIISILLVILGTYLLSKQLFIKIILNKFIKSQLAYQKYENIPLGFKIIGYIYGIKPSNWKNLGTYGGDNQIERKLKDLSAPFRGIIYVVIAGILQVICILLDK